MTPPDPYMTPKWPLDCPQMTPPDPLYDPYVIPYDLKMTPKWPLYDPQLTPMYMTKMTHKWPLDYPQMTPPGPYDLQLTPMWTHMIKMTPQITLKYNWTAPTLPWWIVLMCV